MASPGRCVRSWRAASDAQAQAQAQALTQAQAQAQALALALALTLTLKLTLTLTQTQPSQAGSFSAGPAAKAAWAAFSRANSDSICALPAT